jgi:hypothetical protein
MKDNSGAIDNVAIEVIKAIALNQKSLDVLFDTFAKQATMLGEDSLNEKSKSELKSLVVSEGFLREFIEKFKELFTKEEAEELLTIYQSDVMKKWFEVGENLLGPLYFAINTHIKEGMKNSNS